MLWRGPELEVMPICEELGIGFVCWSPMGVGFLSGTITADSRFGTGGRSTSAPTCRASPPRP